MKTSTLSVITVTLLLLGAHIQAEESVWPSVTVSSLVANQYLGFGTGNSLSKDPALQTDLLFSFKNGLYVDLWNSRSLNGSWNDGNLGNEVDYGVGWKGDIAPHLNLNVGITYFDEPKALTFGAGDIIYPHIFLTRDFKWLSVIAGYENYTTMPGSGFKGGNLFSLGISKYQLFCKDRIAVHASVAGVYDMGTLGSSEGFILRGNVGSDWNMTKRLTFNVLGVNWYTPITAHDRRVTDAVVYSGLTLRLR